MEYNGNENAIAIFSGGKWILKPVCSGAADAENALAVRTPAGHVFSPASQIEAGINAVLVDGANGNKIAVPIGCPQEDEGENCTGDDPLCNDCPCAANLRSSYTATISGFPTTCSADAFNGSWTMTWRSDCVWSCDIDDYRIVSMLMTTGGYWRISWATYNIGTIGGSFIGSGSPACAPTYYTWTYDICDSVWGCWNLCSNIQANAVVIVS